MPFASKAQRRYLFAKEPAVAREFAAATPKGAKLPEKANKKKPAKPYASAAAERLKR